MSATAGWQIEDRSSRHVRSARLCIPTHAPRHRLIATIEESLRLSALPGENEGRTYYFRRLRLSGLPVDGDRRVWLDAFQRVLTQEAAAAIHGNDPRAGMAQAVFFRSLPEALEILLRRIVERRAVPEWFWPMVMSRSAPGIAPSPSNSTEHTPTSTVRTVPAIVEALSATPATWVAVAAAVFAEPRTDPVYLLQAIPTAKAQAWLEEMDGRRPVPAASLEPRISVPARRAVEAALLVFGFESPRAVWLTALAILHESPAEMAAGTLVERARMVLRKLASEGCASTPSPVETQLSLGPPTAAVPTTPAPAPAVAGADSAAGRSAPLARPDSIQASASSIPTEQPAPRPPDSLPPRADLASPPIAATPESQAGPEPLASVSPAAPGTRTPADTPAIATVKAPSVPLPWSAEGFATQAAGLFFLLNVLKRIGIARAFASGLAAARPDFLALILQRLAAHAGVAEDDPTVVWLASLIGDPPDDSPLPCKDWGPSNLAFSRPTATLEDLVRAWVLAVRRWCWRTGRITVRETVTRSGVFSVNRTDLDVSLPLDEADIRIRRIGLDLDPGWLPWFGRVVRFHYLYRREFHG